MVLYPSLNFTGCGGCLSILNASLRMTSSQITQSLQRWGQKWRRCRCDFSIVWNHYLRKNKKSIYNCFKLICKMKHFKISKLHWSYFVPCFLYFWSIIVKNWTIFVFSPCELLCKSKASALEVCVIIRGLFWTSDDGTWVEILEKYGLKNVRTHLSTQFLVVCKKKE